MKKFLVLFLTPIEIMEDWMQRSPEERKKMESDMSKEWDAWMKNNMSSFVEEPVGAGKPKIVTGTGVADARNDVMMWAIVQAKSHDEAAKIFKGHPHLQIPESSIELMEMSSLKDMRR